MGSRLLKIMKRPLRHRGRKKGLRILLSLLFSVSLCHDLSSSAVIDVGAIAKMGEMLSVSNKMLGNLSDLQNEISMVNNVMGSPLDMSSIGENTSQFSEFGSVLDSLNSNPGEALNRLNTDYRGGRDHSNLLFMKDYAREKLHNLQPQNNGAESALDVSYASKPMSVTQQQEILQARQDLLVTTSSNGLALSDNQKKMVVKNQRALESLSKKSPGRTMIELQLRQIKLQELTVNALNQHTVLLAQLTETLSSLVASATPVAFRGAPGQSQASPSSTNIFGGN